MKLTWHRRQLRLSHPFKIARRLDQSVDKTVLLVEIEHQGRTGLGEAAPTSFYRQTLDSSEAALSAAAGLLGDDPFAFEAIHERLRARIADQPAAIAAIDGALHDLCGRLLGIPVWRWLGVDRAKMPLTSFTIGIDDLDIMARKVREAAEYPVLKIKVGTPQDEAVLEMMRREAPDKVLRVDANCGWTAGTVEARCRELARFNLELIEQPCPPEDASRLTFRAEGRAGEESRKSKVESRIAAPEASTPAPPDLPPLIADESCVGVGDVLGCVGVFDGINVKLSKCGGIRPALQMIHTARAAGLRIMLGCMVETSVGIAAAAQLAPLVDYVDLDGHLLLANDPFEGIGGRQGRLTLNDRPGLGVARKAP